MNKLLKKLLILALLILPLVGCTITKPSIDGIIEDNNQEEIPSNNKSEVNEENPDNGNDINPDEGNVTTPDNGDDTNPDEDNGNNPDNGDDTNPDEGNGNNTDNGDDTNPDDGNGGNPDQGDATTPDDGNGTNPDDEVKVFSLTSPNFETRKISDKDSVTMEDFFNLGNKIDIKVYISSSELNKLHKDSETFASSGKKSEIYRVASKVVITMTNYNQTFTWEFENVGIRQKGNTSRQLVIGDNKLNKNHYKLSFDETFDDPQMYDSSFVKKYGNQEYAKRDFLGLSGFDFKWNKNYDMTHIREIYAGYLYRAAGILNQQSGLSNFSIVETDNNNRVSSMGLCTVFEPATKSMIKRALKSDVEYINMGDWATEKAGLYGIVGENYGDLYKCLYSANLTNVSGNVGVSNYDGSYAPLYDRKTAKDVAYDDNQLKTIANAIKSGDYDKISQYVDLEYLAICEAVGYVVGNPDSMRYNTNNYMVYIRRTDGKLVFIPIDSDRCFGITKDWNVKSGMTSFSMLDRKNSNNKDTISLLLNTVLANTTNDCQKLYLQFCQTIKESDWAKNETFEKYYNIAKSTYSEHSFSTSSDSNNMSFNDYINKKMSMIGEVDTTFNIYLAGDFNGWSGKDYKLSTTNEVVYTITINVEKNYIQSDNNGNYYKFKFSDGSFTTLDWTLSSDLKTVIKNANGVSSARCYGVKSGDSITITINIKTLEASVVINQGN